MNKTFGKVTLGASFLMAALSALATDNCAYGTYGSYCCYPQWNCTEGGYQQWDCSQYNCGQQWGYPQQNWGWYGPTTGGTTSSDVSVGWNSLSVTKDLDAMSFSSDFTSVWEGSKLGYYVYQGDCSAVDVNAAIAQQQQNGAALYGSGDKVEISSLKEGDKVGFYLQRPDGTTVKDFYLMQGQDGKTYLAFNSNPYWGWYGGYSEWMAFSDFQFTEGTIGGGDVVRGTPLPAGPVAAGLALILGGLASVRRRLRA